MASAVRQTDRDDTIFALSSGALPAAIAIVRLSGPHAFQAAAALGATVAGDRRFHLCELRDPDDGDLLDRALVVGFAAPDTATGEDLMEFHLHGGPAVVARVERVLGTMAGLRPAEPGEFTRRALMHGRIDLTEAEGLGDLLNAESEAHRKAAMRSAAGGVRRMIERWQARLLVISAQVEAQIEFEEEEDVASGFDSLATFRRHIAELGADIRRMLSHPMIERFRDGVRVVLAGSPNAGKSSLLNMLVDRDAAIVADIAGTTRDRVEVSVVRNGQVITLIDTAGLALQTDDPIERIGIERAREAMTDADILLWVDDSDPPPHKNCIAIHPRADGSDRRLSMPERLATSVHRPETIIRLWAEIDRRVKTIVPAVDGAALNRRQASLAGDAMDALMAAERADDIILVAEGLRVARQSFDAVTGSAATEDMLSSLFSNFCIGK